MAMITEDYVSFEIAKLLKEKGFDICCELQYINCSSGHPFLTDIRDDAGCYYKNSEIGQDEYSAPTLQMAMKWLREKYSIHIEIAYNMKYFPVCISIKTNETIPYIAIQGEPFTYEQAAEAAIKYCLENLI